MNSLRLCICVLLTLVERSGRVSALTITPVENQYHVMTGSEATLNWTITGSGFTGIKWSTNSSTRGVEDIWRSLDNGTVDDTFKPPPAYNGRLSSNLDGSVISLIINNLKLNDSNKYLCTLLKPIGSVTSSEITLNVTDPPPTTQPPFGPTDPPPTKNHTGAVVGGVVGGVAVIGIIICVVVYCKKKGSAQEGPSKGEAGGVDSKF